MGCDEGPATTVETEPAHVEPAESPEPLAPARFIARNTAFPSELACPGPEICVREHDSALWVLKRGWDHHYRFDYGDSETAIRVAGAVTAVLTEEGATAAVGHCSLVALMPELYSVTGDALVVDVPQAELAPARPASIPPIVANAHLRSEYAFIDLTGAESMVWFTNDEMQRMSGGTFEDPRVRHVSRERTIDGNHRTLDLLVAFSPESENVYVLERTRELPEDEYQSTRDERRRTDEQALVDFLRSLHVSRVSYDATAACEIPAAFGGSEWMPLRLRSPAN